MENPCLQRGPYFHALKCPFCPHVFVESLWSLVSHLNISHANEQETFKFSFANLERQKKLVPKQQVCIIRPAFNETNEPTDFLRMLITYSGADPVKWAQCGRQPATPEAVEMLETFATSRKETRTCMECGEIVPRKLFLDHCSKHVTNINRPPDGTSHGDPSNLSDREPINSPSSSDSTSAADARATADNPKEQENIPIGIHLPLAIPRTSIEESHAVEERATNSSSNDISLLFGPAIPSTSPSLDAIDGHAGNAKHSKKRATPGLPTLPGRKMTISKIISLMCPQCGMGFENRCKLTRHLIDHKMAANPYRCPIANCLQSYDSRNKYRSHLTRCHQQLEPERVEALLLQGDEELNRIRTGQKPASIRSRGLTPLESVQLSYALTAQSPMLPVAVERSGSDGYQVPAETLQHLAPNSHYVAMHNGTRIGIVLTHGRSASGSKSGTSASAIQVQIVLDNEEAGTENFAEESGQGHAMTLGLETEQATPPPADAPPPKRRVRSLDEAVDRLLKREVADDACDVQMGSTSETATATASEPSNP